MAVLAVEQPVFTDLQPKSDIESVINRLNGLAITEGYLNADGTRTFDPNKLITGAEFAVMQAKVLGMVQPGQQQLYDILPMYQPDINNIWYMLYTDQYSLY